MATAKDFVVRVDQVEGVDGCLLVKRTGVCWGRLWMITKLMPP